MNNEAPAEIGASIAIHARAARLSGNFPSLALSEAIDRLVAATGTTSLDALAFLSVARKILFEAGPYLSEDIEGEREALIATHFVYRAVEALEIATGYSAEGFTGETDATN